MQILQCLFADKTYTNWWTYCFGSICNTQHSFENVELYRWTEAEHSGVAQTLIALSKTIMKRKAAARIDLNNIRQSEVYNMWKEELKKFNTKYGADALEKFPPFYSLKSTLHRANRSVYPRFLSWLRGLWERMATISSWKEETFMTKLVESCIRFTSLEVENSWGSVWKNMRFSWTVHLKAAPRHICKRWSVASIMSPSLLERYGPSGSYKQPSGGVS